MADPASKDVIGIILAGGRGERLWPLTRQDRPKPLLRVGGDETLLMQAVGRLEAAGIPRTAQRIVGDMRHEAALRPAAPGIDIVLEPKGFNTAHSVALAAVQAAQKSEDAILVVVPSDHVIRNPAPLIEAIRRGIACARQTRRLTVFGVKPTGVSTAYGHLRAAETLGESDPARALGEYVEKPSPERAAAMTAAGYLWNCGMFVFPVRELLAVFRRFQPEILAAATALVKANPQSSEALHQLEPVYGQGPQISVDHAIMESAAAAGMCAVVPLDFERIDAGNLVSVAALFPSDENNNAASGPALFLDSQQCFASSKGPLVTVLGLQGVVVAVENDVVLVCSRERAQDVRRVLAELRSRSRDDLL